MNRFLTSRLAAHTGIRQVEVSIRADAAASAADRAAAAVWVRAMRLLKQPLSPFEARLHARHLFGGLYAGIHANISKNLARTVSWGHKTAVAAIRQTLPVRYLRAAALRKIQRLPESVQLLEDDAPAEEEGEGAGAVILRALGLEPIDLTDILREPSVSFLSTERQASLFMGLLFPPPSEAETHAMIHAPYAGYSWEQKLSLFSRAAPPEQLAQIVGNGFAAGKTQQEIAKDLLPAFDGIDGARTVARRVARTATLNLAHEVQHKAHEQLGDLKDGYQVHATLDQHTRPWHALRNGTIYYDEPAPTQKGPEQRPNPPFEAADPSERPAGTPQLAHNCRCYLTPVLKPLDEMKSMPEFTNSNGDLLPDPVIYSDWFDRADLKRRRIAVGARRYAAMSKAKDGEPRWEDFVDPETGALVPMDRIKAESETARSERVAKVRIEMLRRQDLIRQVSRFGFAG